MSGEIEFVSNYNDLSTDRGFQFEFFCDRCGAGVRTRFRPFAAGTVSGVLDAAGSLLGGVFGSAADIGERVRSAGWQSAHDSAFAEAVEEVSDRFAQCPRCSAWVCVKSCWSERRGLCKGCAPDVGVEMSAAQASRTVEEIWAHAAMADEDRQLEKPAWRQTIRATCPSCKKPLDANAKFCPECGTKIKQARHCTECGAKIPANAKFCAECGTKVGPA